MIKCRKCNKQFPIGAKFCSDCGMSIQFYVQKCKDCTEFNQTNANYCMYCGSQNLEAYIPKTNEETQELIEKLRF